jgi:hypothetical protein
MIYFFTYFKVYSIVLDLILFQKIKKETSSIFDNTFKSIIMMPNW